MAQLSGHSTNNSATAMLESPELISSVLSSADPPPSLTETLVASAPAANPPSLVLSAKDLRLAFSQVLCESLPHILVAMHLSSPLRHSFNDSIPEEPFSLQYMKVDDVISGIMSYGEGALMAKFDVESMYPNVPLHSDDDYFLGMKWQGNYFSNLAPPFGLPSAPFIFPSTA